MENGLREKTEYIEEKSKLVAYILWGLMGGLGVHRFYLRRYVSGFIIMLLTIISIVIEGEEFATVLFFISMIWAIFDLFFIPYMVKIVNVDLALDKKGKK